MKGKSAMGSLLLVISLAAKEPKGPTAEQTAAICDAHSAYVEVIHGRAELFRQYPFLGRAIELMADRRNLSLTSKGKADLVVTVDRLSIDRKTVEVHDSVGKTADATTSTRIKGRITLEARGARPYRVNFDGHQLGPWIEVGFDPPRYLFAKCCKVEGNAFDDGYVSVLKLLFDFCK